MYKMRAPVKDCRLKNSKKIPFGTVGAQLLIPSKLAKKVSAFGVF